MNKVELIIVYTVSFILIIWTFFPIYNMIVTSFKSYWEIWTTTYFPMQPTLEAYYRIFTQSYYRVELFWTWLWNSVRIALGVMVASLFIGTCTGYFISKRIISRVKRELRTLTLLAYIFPSSFLSLPLFKLMGMYGLLDTDFSVILALTTLVSPYTSWMMAEYLDNIPKEIDEAAAIDGASRITILIRILLPISAPAIIALLVYSFLYSWNSYLYPLVMLSSEKNLTLPVSMGFFLSTDDAPWNIFMGVGLIYSLPPIILYYTFRRYLVSGLFRGAVKA
ncbi:MAG: carbohydrate ABC transporter permease [Nitrososphaeria archaeon]|uniref:carbohydrate ABC transporter permease n=1 Tax=Saccharolobus sp. TaxID=2100761 RepID=UPI0031799960